MSRVFEALAMCPCGCRGFEVYPESRQDDRSPLSLVWCNRCGCHKADHGRQG